MEPFRLARGCRLGIAPGQLAFRRAWRRMALGLAAAALIAIMAGWPAMMGAFGAAAGMRRERIHHRRARQDRACDQDGKQRESRRNGAKLLRKLYDTAMRCASKSPQRLSFVQRPRMRRNWQTRWI